jgi:hypothetical protein
MMQADARVEFQNLYNMNGESNMSHFYGVIAESARKTQPTARAHHSLRVEAQSWQGKIVTRLRRERGWGFLRSMERAPRWQRW